MTVQLTAAILMLEFNVKDGMIAVTQLQNSPNMTMQDSVGKYMKLHKLKKVQKPKLKNRVKKMLTFVYRR